MQKKKIWYVKLWDLGTKFNIDYSHLKIKIKYLYYAKLFFKNKHAHCYNRKK